MAAKLPVGCLVWLVAGVVVIGAISRCGDDPTSPIAAIETDGAISTRPTDWLYVQPASANCRAEPSTRVAATDSVARNTSVGVLRREDGWALVDRSPDCWIRSDLLGERRAVEPQVRPLMSSSGRGSNERSSRRSNSSAYYANCSAARAAGAAPVMRGEPGYARRLDRDGDGVGCE